MLFKDRLEIWNPGHLPFGLTVAKLYQSHPSIPGNPLLAEPMYLAGYIERMGTGTRDIIRLCREVELKSPEFVQEEIFKTIIWRTRQETRQEEGEVSEAIKRMVLVLDGEMKRAEIQSLLGLKDRENFVLNYLTPSLDSNFVEMTFPETPRHKKQRYRLTRKGIDLRNKLAKPNQK